MTEVVDVTEMKKIAEEKHKTAESLKYTNWFGLLLAAAI